MSIVINDRRKFIDDTLTAFYGGDSEYVVEEIEKILDSEEIAREDKFDRVANKVIFTRGSKTKSVRYAKFLMEALGYGDVVNHERQW